MASAPLMLASAVDKENSGPCLSNAKPLLSGIDRSPAKLPLADMANLTLTPVKEKGMLKGGVRSPQSAGKQPQSTPVLSSKDTPVKCLSTYWLERYHTAQELMQRTASTPPRKPPVPEAAPTAPLDPEVAQASASPVLDGPSQSEALTAPDSMGDNVIPAEPLVSLNPPSAREDPPSTAATLEPPVECPVAAPLSFPLSPKAKPFIPKSATTQGTPLSPKAPPFFPKVATPHSMPLSPKARPFLPSRWALFQDPSAAAESPVPTLHRALDLALVTSPVMLPLTQPTLLTSPSSLSTSLSKTTSSNSMFAPTREQAKAKELSHLESLWVRRSTPVKQGEKPPSPTGNVLTSPETWNAVNWWSPSNKPLRHSAVQVEVPNREEAATETEDEPKKLFSETDTMTEAMARLESMDVTTEIDGDLHCDSTAESVTSSGTQEMQSWATSPSVKAMPLQQGPRGHLTWRALLRPKRNAKSRSRAARLLAQRVRRETLSRSSSGAWSSSLSSGDSLRLDSVSQLCGVESEPDDAVVVAPLLPAPMVAEADTGASPCLSDVSLRTACSGCDGAAASPVAAVTDLPRPRDTLHTIVTVSSPTASPIGSSEGRGPRIVIRLPRSKGASRDRRAPSPALQIISGGVTIDVIQE